MPVTREKNGHHYAFKLCTQVAMGYPSVVQKCMSSTLMMNVKKGKSPNRDLKKKLQIDLYRSILKELEKTKLRLQKRLREIDRRIGEILPEPFQSRSTAF